MTDEDRSDWSLCIVVSAVCAFFAVCVMILSIHTSLLNTRRCEEIEAHLVEVEKQMVVQRELFAQITKDLKGGW